MMDRFYFDPTTMRDLIATRYFTVPRYQRSYAWTVDETTDYWNDMFSAISEGGDYFFGSIVLTKNENDQSYSIIDGQQRIATTTILNAAIRDKYISLNMTEMAGAVQQELICALDTATSEKIARIQLNETDNPFYRALIVDRSRIPATCDSHELIEQAYEFFMSKLSEVIETNPNTWQKEFGSISKFLKTQSRMVAVYTASDADAFTIFETLNDRGADLTIADLLKNYLFSKSAKEIDSVQANWMESRAILVEYQDETDFVMFLRHYWSSTHGMTRERELYKKIKAAVTDKSQSVKLALDLKAAARLYGATLSEKSDFWKTYSDTDRNNFKLLLRLKLEQNRPLLLAIYQHFSKQEIQKTIPALVSWSVRGLIAGVMGKGAAETSFCDAALKVRSGAIKTKDQLSFELDNLIPRDSAFTSSFGIYRTSNNALARYLLLGIERFLSGEKQPEYIPNENVDDVNLEHILPRKAKKGEWPDISVDEVPFHSLRLGNMTLLKEKSNNELGNKAFNIKQPVLSSSAFKLNSDFKSLTSWTKADIEARQNRFAQIAPLIWRV